MLLGWLLEVWTCQWPLGAISELLWPRIGEKSKDSWRQRCNRFNRFIISDQIVCTLDGFPRTQNKFHSIGNEKWTTCIRLMELIRYRSQLSVRDAIIELGSLAPVTVQEFQNIRDQVESLKHQWQGWYNYTSRQPSQWCNKVSLTCRDLYHS